MVRKSEKRIDISKLLRLLRGNARLRYTELAELLGVSEASVRKALKRLLEAGVIVRFLAEYDYKKLNKVEAFIGINVKPEKLIHVVDNIKENFSEIDIIYLTSGDHDIIVHAVLENIEELENICKNLENLEGVTGVYPATVVEKIFKI